MKPLLNGLKQIIYPPVCPVCRQRKPDEAHGACTRCADALNWLPGPWCKGCGGTLDTVLELCTECLQLDRPWEHAYSLFDYGGLVRQVVHRFKYQGDVALAPWLARRALERWRDQQLGEDPDWVTPVPLHWFKQWRRGYNQTSLLAEVFAKEAQLQLADCLERPRWTKPQASLSLKERKRNLQGAFGYRLDFDFTGKRVLLFDDVLTTGSTLAACTRQLQQAGVATVQVLTIARG